jgi:hypothetical protein
MKMPRGARSPTMRTMPTAAPSIGCSRSATLRWRSFVERIAEMLPSRDRWLPLLAGSLEAASAPDAAQLERIRALFDADLAFLVTRSLGQAAAAIGAERIEVLSRLIAGRPRASASSARSSPVARR